MRTGQCSGAFEGTAKGLAMLGGAWTAIMGIWKHKDARQNTKSSQTGSKMTSIA
jgi:hypothetical protein